MKIIAKIYNDYTDKFGIPRQSGIVENVSRIIFEPEYRVREALVGLTEYNYIWLLWQFSQTPPSKKFTPTVRPPKLGGNKRVGVFATRSPFRPNPIGLSCVKLLKVDFTKNFGPVIHVSGADIMNGSPIYDIKPYIPYADCKIDAKEGFSVSPSKARLNVEFSSGIEGNYDQEFLDILADIICQNPAPSYQKDANRIYKFEYAQKTVSFKITNGVVNVIKIE